jgi:hypothetical protein
MPAIKKLVSLYMADETGPVREAAVVAVGAIIGRFSDPRKGFASYEAELLKLLNDKQETPEMLRATARALCVALSMLDGSKRVDALGLQLTDASLRLAMGGAQRVQYAFNDVLWVALDVPSGDDGLNRYCNIAVFDNIRSMKSLYAKVLTKMTECSMLND